jgi:hypothetical protein
METTKVVYFPENIRLKSVVPVDNYKPIPGTDTLTIQQCIRQQLSRTTLFLYRMWGPAETLREKELRRHDPSLSARDRDELDLLMSREELLVYWTSLIGLPILFATAHLTNAEVATPLGISHEAHGMVVGAMQDTSTGETLCLVKIFDDGTAPSIVYSILTGKIRGCSIHYDVAGGPPTMRELSITRVGRRPGSGLVQVWNLETPYDLRELSGPNAGQPMKSYTYTYPKAITNYRPGVQMYPGGYNLYTFPQPYVTSIRDPTSLETFGNPVRFKVPSWFPMSENRLPPSQPLGQFLSHLALARKKANTTSKHSVPLSIASSSSSSSPSLPPLFPFSSLFLMSTPVQVESEISPLPLEAPSAVVETEAAVQVSVEPVAEAAAFSSEIAAVEAAPVAQSEPVTVVAADAGPVVVAPASQVVALIDPPTLSTVPDTGVCLDVAICTNEKSLQDRLLEYRSLIQEIRKDPDLINNAAVQALIKEGSCFAQEAIISKRSGESLDKATEQMLKYLYVLLDSGGMINETMRASLQDVASRPGKYSVDEILSGPIGEVCENNLKRYRVDRDIVEQYGQEGLARLRQTGSVAAFSTPIVAQEPVAPISLPSPPVVVAAAAAAAVPPPSLAARVTAEPNKEILAVETQLQNAIESMGSRCADVSAHRSVKRPFQSMAAAYSVSLADLIGNNPQRQPKLARAQELAPVTQSVRQSAPLVQAPLPTTTIPAPKQPVAERSCVDLFRDATSSSSPLAFASEPVRSSSVAAYSAPIMTTHASKLPGPSARYNSEPSLESLFMGSLSKHKAQTNMLVL